MSSSILNSETIEMLIGLQKDTGTPIFFEVVDLFVTTTQHEIDKMFLLFKSSDFKALGKVSHSLKSSSGNLGAMDFSSICYKIEDLILSDSFIANDQQKAQLFTWLENLNKQLPLINSALLSEKNKLHAA